MFSFTDKLKPFFNISSTPNEPQSPDPLIHLPPSTQIHPNRIPCDSNHNSLKNSSYDYTNSNTDVRNSPQIANQQEGRDSPINIAAIRSILNSLPLAMRVLIIQQPRLNAQKSPLILFDSRDLISPCAECQRSFTPDIMSELVFGNCYLVAPTSGLKLQTLHNDSVLLSKVLCHNATHLIRSSYSSTQVLSKLSNSLIPNHELHNLTSSLGTRCKTATSSRPQMERDISSFTKPLSSSLDSKFSKQPNPMFASHINSQESLHLASGGLVVSGSSDYVISSSPPTVPIINEINNSPTKSATKSRRLAIVLTFHEKEVSPIRIDELYSNFIILENYVNQLTDDIYDIIESATAATFRPRIANAIEEFLSDLSSSLFTLSTSAHVVPHNALALVPIQLCTLNDCSIQDIPKIITKLHTQLNCNPLADNFLSRFLTAFFTYHHSWLVSLLQETRNTDKFQKLSSHLEVIASRYGYSPASPFLCKIILLDQERQVSEQLLSQIIKLLSYFFRYQLDVIYPNKSETPTRDMTPSNEDFLIISMSLDSTDTSIPKSALNSSIQFYTYNPSEEVEDATYENYKQIPFGSDTSYTDMLEDDQPAVNNSSILTYTRSNKHKAVVQCIAELKQLYSHLEGSSQDELFSLEDNLYELGCLSSSLPPPTLIIADFNTYTVEVIHDDTVIDDLKENVLAKAIPQKQSKLIHSMLDMVSSICQPLGEDEGNEGRDVSSEIGLVYLENTLEDLRMKAECAVKHLKGWLEVGNSLDDRDRVHDFFSELVCLLRVDSSDLRLLLRMGYIVAPEERNALEKLISFLLAY